MEMSRSEVFAAESVMVKYRHLVKELKALKIPAVERILQTVEGVKDEY